MDASLRAALAPQEERVQIGPVTLVVRELAEGVVFPETQDRNEIDRFFLLNCVFTEGGAPAFTEEGLASPLSVIKMTKIRQALNRVNGGDEALNEKK